jgi:NOL1/NOP2/fmu family ribosome biogenesis protein
MKFIKSSHKKKLLAELKEIYGLTSLPYQLIQGGKQKIRAFSGSLTREQLLALAEQTHIELVGMYFLSLKDAEPRLNFDAVSLLKNQITKNIVEIDEKQFQMWIRGYDLELKTQRGTIVIKHKNDLIGIGKSNGERIYNYIPKERKIKTPLK